MPQEVYTTTAEDIIGATDAILQAVDSADENLVADFLDIPIDNARNALGMAQQLGLININNNGNFIPIFPYACYLVTGNIQHKAAILRLILEQYLPYKAFKNRLRITNSVQDAANQVRALFHLTANRGEIISTFVSLGTFTNSIIAEGAGRYKVSDNDELDYLSILNDVIQNRESAEAKVRKAIGITTSNWVDYQEVLVPLVTAYQKAATAEDDPRAPIVYTGNAIESFLVQVAQHFNINIIGANGINAKADRIANASHLKDKHKFMVKYLGHVRNAADHGVDLEIGQAWKVSKDTSVAYVFVAFTVLSAIVEYIENSDYIV